MTGLSAPAWPEIPVEFAAILRPRVDTIADEMIRAILRELGTGRRSVGGAFGRNVVAAVRRALAQFADLVEDPGAAGGGHAGFFRDLGRAEFRSGRGMDLLQAAYRIGARVACRRYMLLAHQAGLSTEVVLVLSEAVLIHINALATESVRGFEAARRELDAVRVPEARRVLAERIVDRTSAPLPALAAQARWPLPGAVACVLADVTDVTDVTDAEDLAGGFDRDVLVLPRAAELVLVVPEALLENGIGRIGDALDGARAVVGPAVAPADGWLSLHCARSVAALIASGAVRSPGGVVFAAEHLGDVLLADNDRLMDLVARRALADLTGVGEVMAARLAETLAALLNSWSRTAPEVAEALGVHPQTVRNRMRRLDRIFGDRLLDPDFRFEALLALRHRALTGT